MGIGQVFVLQRHTLGQVRSSTGSRVCLGHCRVLLQPRRTEKHKHFLKQHFLSLTESQRSSLSRSHPIAA